MTWPQITVTKRNGDKVPYSVDKILIAVVKAFNANGAEYPVETQQDILSDMNIYDGIPVEEIQEQVQTALMKNGFYKVAVDYIKYREVHKELREDEERLQYMENYSKSGDNAASSSETDPNSNVSMKNAANLEGEVYKRRNRRLQRRRMQKRLRTMYGKELADQYIKDLKNHIIYVHDEASTPVLKPYCGAITTYPLLCDGVGNVDNVTPFEPNDISSFSGQMTNLIFLVSSQLKGAVACLHGSQTLLIDGQEVPIKEFVARNWDNAETSSNGWEYCYVDGPKVFEDGKYVAVKRVFRKPYKDQIYRIKSNKGYTALTSKDHKFKVLSRGVIQEVPAEKLHLFDTVFVNNNIPVDFTGKPFKEGWVKGMMFGDGCLTVPNRIHLAVNYDQEYYGEMFNSYVQELYQTTVPQYNGHKCFQYEKQDPKLYQQVMEGMIGSNAFDKNLASTEHSIDFLVGVLDGLLCADGSDHHSIGLSLVNKGLIDTVCKILDILRIPYSRKEVPAHDNKATLYCLSISTEVLKYTPNFCLKLPENKQPKEVYYYSGWSRERDVSNKNTIVPTGKNKFRFPGYKTDVITSIETFDNDDDYVYEIETETHWYNCGGFITHNCGDYFVALNYYVIQQFGKNWYDKLDVITTTDHCLQPSTIRRDIRKGMKQFIYGINQPAGNRSYNSPFTNVSYYDRYYFKAMFEDFCYPDGSKPEWKAIDTLQRMFMELHRELRLIKPLTFPVSTMALVHDGKKYLDPEYKELCAEEWAKGGSFFCYNSDNPSSLASCCFSKGTKFLWKSSTFGVNLTTFEEFDNMPYKDRKENFKVFHNGSWVAGKLVKLPNRKMYKVLTENNKEFVLTDNHINVTLNGEKETSALTTDDYLMFNTQSLDATPEQDEHLTYEQGFVVGAFLGDGSFGATIKDSIYQIEFSQNVNKYKECMAMINIANKQLGHNTECTLKTPVENKYPVSICSKPLCEFIIKWTNWHREVKAPTKELNLNCLLQSKAFRQGILDGWYNTDGGNSNRCYTTSSKLAECMEAVITSLGKQSIINVSDRTDEPVAIRGQEYQRHYPLYCVRWYEDGNHRTNKDTDRSWIKHNNSVYFKIKSIEEVSYDGDVYCIECSDKEPYFTLPSGLITHNCRVLNEMADNTFSSTTGMTGIMTGSCNVITLNINRIVQDFAREKYGKDVCAGIQLSPMVYPELATYLTTILERVYKYHITYKTLLYEQEERGMYTYSNAGYLYIKKLYSTIGVLGYCEAAQFLGLKISNNEDYKQFLQLILGTIRDQNKLHSIRDKKRPFLFNSEAVPGENLAVKLYQWDKADGYFVPKDQNLYNCYFYNPWDNNTSILDKLKLHGKEISQFTDGGLVMLGLLTQ